MLLSSVQKVLAYSNILKSILLFFSSSFCISHFKLRYLIYFKLIFVWNERYESNIIFFCRGLSSFSRYHLLNTLSSFYCMFLPTLSERRWPWLCCFVSLPSILLHWSVRFMAAPDCLYHYNSIMYLRSSTGILLAVKNIYYKSQLLF